MQKFYKKYNNKTIEDDGSRMSKEAKKFYQDMKQCFKRIFETHGIQIDTFHTGHYDMFCFLEHKGSYIYISHNLPRYDTPVNLNNYSPMYGFLYRTAKSNKDYRGRINHFCNLMQLETAVTELFERGE